MKQWKERARRLQAGVLAFAMCLSLAVTGVWAEGPTTKKGEVAPGAFVAENGKLGGYDQNAENTVATLGGKVSVTKFAEAVECEDGNQFEVTLQVKTEGEEIKTITSPDAAVTLVIDLSSSMRSSDLNEKDKTRLQVAQAAAKDFVDSFVSNANGARRMVALVGFWGGGEIVPLGGNGVYWINAADPTNDNENLKLVKAAIDDLPTDKNGTNIQAGLQLAANLYDQRNKWAEPVGDIENRFSVLLTDGEPYDRIIGAVNGTETHYDSDGNNTKNDGSNRKYPTEAARKLIAAGIQSYAICFASDVQKDWMKTADETTTTEDKVVIIEWEWKNGQWEIDEYKKADDWKPGNKEIGDWRITIDGASYDAKYYYNDEDELITRHIVPGKTTTVPKTFDMAVKADGADALKLQFQTINELIRLSVEAWTVTDPMADGVKFEGFVGSQGSAAEKDNLITWDLKQEKTNVKTNTEDNKTTVTYTLKYLVTVDATGQHYDEDAVHPLNKYTELKYMFLKNDQRVDEDGNPNNSTELDTIGFNVPGVIVERPERPWRIEYYKQAQDGSYTLVDTTKSAEDVDIWTQIKLEEKDPDYESKYNSDNYKWVKTDNAVLTVSKDGDNVIKVYYDRKTTSATVNHYYKIVTTKADGTVETREWPVDKPDWTVTRPLENETLYVGTPFTADEITTWDSKSGFTLDTRKSDKKAITLKENPAENVINLYYTLEIDEREESKIEVKHVYRTHTWILKDGKYELVDTKTDPIAADSYTGKVGLSQTVSTEPTTGYEDYEFNAGDSNLTNPVPFPKSGTTTVTLYFDKTIDSRTSAMLTVTHHYTKTVTEIVDGKAVTTTPVDNETISDQVSFYLNETVTLNEEKDWYGETYVSDPTNANKLIVTPTADNQHVDLYYTLEKEPDTTTVTVTHIYQTIPTKTVSVYTVGGDTEITTIKGEPKEDNRESDPAIELYVGQSHTATPKPSGNGYSYAEEAEGNTPDLTTKAPGEIFIIYQRDAEEKPENENDAWIRETHIYYTNLETIVGGEVKTIRVYDGGETIDAVDKVGTLYKAEQKLTFGENTYTLKTGEETVSKTLVKGDNGTIEFVYEREASDLADISYTVSYEYYTRNMTVVDGVAVWGEPVLDTETTKTPGNGYVGQKVTLDTGAKDGYYAMAGNPSATQFLAESGNEWTFRYVKDVPLEKVPVTVNHHITTKTLTIDGEFELAQDLMGRPEYKYKGESYEAKALELGEKATLTLVNVNGGDVETAKTITGNALTGAVVIDFYYEIVIDYRVPAAYTVQHIYKTIDWNGAVTIDNPNAMPSVFNDGIYAGMAPTVTVSLPENAGYELTEATYNGSDVKDRMSEGAYNFTVLAGANDVVFTYVRHVDTRPTTSVKVIHQYYASANSETPAYTDEENFTENLRVPSDFTATPKPTKNDVTYTRTTEDSALTITLVENAADNVITIKYVRAATTYTVVHEYYTDGTLTGSTSSVVAGTVGATITADGITKVTTYGGNTYTYTSAAGAPLTLVQGENGTITLRYYRTTPTEPEPSERPDPTPTPKPSETPNPTETPAPTETPEPTPAPTEPPAPIEDLGDNDVPMNQLPGDVVDLWDEDVALSDLPEELEELSDEDVPLAQAPATGDSLLTWLSGALASGTGLLWLGGRKKREDEDDEI